MSKALNELVHKFLNGPATAKVPNYSESIEAAWELVESFPLSEYMFEIKNCCQEEFANWCVFFFPQNDYSEFFEGQGDTPAMAITVAFLRAAGAPERKIKKAMKG